MASSHEDNKEATRFIAQVANSAKSFHHIQVQILLKRPNFSICDVS